MITTSGVGWSRAPRNGLRGYLGATVFLCSATSCKGTDADTAAKFRQLQQLINQVGQRVGLVTGLISIDGAIGAATVARLYAIVNKLPGSGERPTMSITTASTKPEFLAANAEKYIAELQSLLVAPPPFVPTIPGTTVPGTTQPIPSAGPQATITPPPATGSFFTSMTSTHRAMLAVGGVALLVTAIALFPKRKRGPAPAAAVSGWFRRRRRR